MKNRKNPKSQNPKIFFVACRQTKLSFVTLSLVTLVSLCRLVANKK